MNLHQENAKMPDIFINLFLRFLPIVIQKSFSSITVTLFMSIICPVVSFEVALILRLKQ